MIKLEPEGHVERALWEALMDLSCKIQYGWTLIGAQMVALHAIENGYPRPRTSRDLDVLADVRMMSNATTKISRILLDDGFELVEPSLSGVAHKFIKGDAIIDVLAPDGLGPKTNVSTSPPLHTVSVPGGSQALKRTKKIEVELDGVKALVPRPNLLGAILIKARAIVIDDVPEAQRRDLAFLCCMAEDPRSLSEQLAKEERGWLIKQKDSMLNSEMLWAGLPNSDNGRLALEILAEDAKQS